MGGVFSTEKGRVQRLNRLLDVQGLVKNQERTDDTLTHAIDEILSSVIIFAAMPKWIQMG